MFRHSRLMVASVFFALYAIFYKSFRIGEMAFFESLCYGREGNKAPFNVEKPVETTVANGRKKLTLVDVIVEGFKAAARGEKGRPAWMEHQLRADQAERDINAYRGLLGEWEQEFKDRFGEASQEYKDMVAENDNIREQLDKDLSDLDNPQTQMKAIEFYRSICSKYRKFEQVEGSHEYRLVKLRREPGVL